MKNDMYRPSGQLQGDNKPMPYRGVSTGVGSTYGANITADAINRLGGMGNAAKSDEPDESISCDPTFGENAADKAEDRGEGPYGS